MPKRYFEVVGERLTVELDMTKDGMNYPVTYLERMYDAKLRELDRKEFNRLTKEYTSN